MTVDVEAFPVIATPAGSVEVTGKAKLGQRFVLELLTPLGSMPYLPARGSMFMMFLRNGGVRSELDVILAFSAGMVQVSQNLQGEELRTDPPEERFLSATLDQIIIGPGTVTISCTVTSRSGDTTEVTTPGLVITP